MKKSGVEKDEKEKQKKNKDGGKKRERGRGGMTAEELWRLDEVRRSLKIKTKRKDKEKLPSGITADYSENFFGDLNRTSVATESEMPSGISRIKNLNLSNVGEIYSYSDSSEASLNSLSNQLSPNKLPPKPPKRGILKGTKSCINAEIDYSFNIDSNSSSLFVKNAVQNEINTYQNVPQNISSNSSLSHMRIPLEDTKNNVQYFCNYSITPREEKNSFTSVVMSTSPSTESLTDATNSTFATPPFSLSPVHEMVDTKNMAFDMSDKCLNLSLPKIFPIQLPKERNLTIQRTSRGDFGFQLRRSVVIDKLSSTHKKSVVFAEPGLVSRNKNETGLLPGDVLLEVNGNQVQNKSKEEIIDMIKCSGPCVSVKVFTFSNKIYLKKKKEFSDTPESLAEVQNLKKKIS